MKSGKEVMDRFHNTTPHGGEENNNLLIQLIDEALAECRNQRRLDSAELPLYEFNLSATEKDPSGYFVPRWDLAEKISVIAMTKDEALKKASVALGDRGLRHGWPWTMIVVDIKEL